MSLAFLRRLRCWVFVATTSVASIDGVPSIGVAQAGEPSSLEAKTKEDASSLYERGAEAYRDGQFREAIGLFLAADDIAPRAALSFNVARAYEKLGESARALEYYRDYLRRDPNSEVQRTVQERIAALEAVLVRIGLQQVTVRSDPAGALLEIDGARYGTTPWTGELSLGAHRLTLTHEGYQAHSAEFRLEKEAAKSLSFLLTEVPASSAREDPDAPATPTRDTGVTSAASWAWMTLGAGALTLVSAGAVEMMRQGEEDAARNEDVQLEYARAYQRQETLQSAARVLAVVGAGLSLTGGIWLWVDASNEGERDARAGLACDASGCVGQWWRKF